MIKYALDLDALRYAMRRAGFQTQSSLAEASETSNEIISRLFRASGREGRGLRASVLLQLADALDVDPHDLMIETEDE